MSATSGFSEPAPISAVTTLRAVASASRSVPCTWGIVRSANGSCSRADLRAVAEQVPQPVGDPRGVRVVLAGQGARVVGLHRPEQRQVGERGDLVGRLGQVVSSVTASAAVPTVRALLLANDSASVRVI